MTIIDISLTRKQMRKKFGLSSGASKNSYGIQLSFVVYLMEMWVFLISVTLCNQLYSSSQIMGCYLWFCVCLVCLRHPLTWFMRVKMKNAKRKETTQSVGGYCIPDQYIAIKNMPKILFPTGKKNTIRCKFQDRKKYYTSENKLLQMGYNLTTKKKKKIAAKGL